MKRLLAATTALTLILSPSMTQASPDNRTTGEQISDAASDAWKALKKGAHETWDAAVKTFDAMTEGTKEIVLPNALPGFVSAKQLIGTPVENATEGRIGKISDVVVGNDNFMDAFVVADGGFLGVGAAQTPVKTRLITLSRSPDGSLKARTNVTDKQLDQAADVAFVTRIEAMNDNFKKPEVKSVSRLLSSSVVAPNGKVVATVDDVVLSPVGEARYAILKVNGPGATTKLVSVPVSSLTFTRAGEPLKTSMTAEQLYRRAPVRY